MDVYSAEESGHRPGHSYDREIRIMFLGREVAVVDADATKLAEVEKILNVINRWDEGYEVDVVSPAIVEAK